MSNRKGAREFVFRFREYCTKKPKVTWRAAWRHLFDALHDVRFWGVKDRLITNGTLDHWLEDLTMDRASVRFEVELWWRTSKDKRRENLVQLQRLVNDAGGHVVHSASIDAIRYCGALIEIPSSALEFVLPSLAAARDDPEQIELPANIALLKCEEVMFFRPRAQANILQVEEEDETDAPSPVSGRPQGDPIVAVLDGVPLENHLNLSERIIVHDPDELAELSLARHRCHGTAMASLIIHGDLHGEGTVLERPIVVRPVMRSDPETGQEGFPDDRLVLDAFHIAIRDLATNPGLQTVKIVNVSLGDRHRLFDGMGPSPWARLLDHLAYEYNLLFIVSVGNSARAVVVDGEPAAIHEMVRSDRAVFGRALLRGIYRDVAHRKLISPAESINAVTVGSLHADDGPPMVESSFVFDPLASPTLPAPTTSFGLGVRRAVKPDLVFAGGRRPFRLPVQQTGEQARRFEIPRSQGRTGHRVAAPTESGRLNGTAWTSGTSNATALTTRAAAQLHEVLEHLRERDPSRAPARTYDAVLLKAMLVHGAQWPVDVGLWQEATGASAREIRDETARAYGYGVPDFDRVAACTDTRATGIGVGSVEDGQALVFSFPLPQCLRGKVTKRRLIATLAYLTPIHAGHQKYRRARLWVDFSGAKKALGLGTPADVASPTVARGTLEHIILEQEGRATSQESRTLEFKVNCRADAGELTKPIPFALMVTLEVAEAEGLPIYQQVRQRLRPRARVRS